MINFKGLYIRRGIFAFGWFLGFVGFGNSPISNTTLVAMLFCLGMLLNRLYSMYNIGFVEKQAYVEYRLWRCRRRINWLDYWCCEYRRQETEVEDELDQWLLLLDAVEE